MPNANALIVTINSRDLLDLSSVAVFAETDQHRPILNGVLLSVDGENLKAVATDSYRLGIITRPTVNVRPSIRDDFPKAFNVPATDLVRVVKSVQPGAKVRDGVEIVLTFSENNVTVESAYGACSCTIDLIEGNYPSVDQLIPARDKWDAIKFDGVAAFNPKYLASVSKLAPFNATKVDATQSLRFRFLETLRPCVITSGDERTMALLMPVRVY
jgi:DNA polymerase III sliding clamp (beta) subunit (PCNA family)